MFGLEDSFDITLIHLVLKIKTAIELNGTQVHKKTINIQPTLRHCKGFKRASLLEAPRGGSKMRPQGLHFTV